MIRSSTIPTRVPLTAEEQVALDVELLQTGYDRQVLGMALLGTTSVIGYIEWLTLFPGPEMLIWATLVLVATLAGTADTWAFKRITLTPQNLPMWKARYFVRSIFTGSAWGIGSTLVASEADGWRLAAVSVMSICMYSGAIVVLTPQWPSLFVYLLAASAATLWQLFFHSDSQALFFGALVMLATVMEMYLGWMLNRSLRSILETQLRLRAAKNEAETANRHKSQFLSHMSHEVRTPLHAVLGMTELMRSTQLTTQQLDYTNKSEIAANSLLGLINDILDFSKIEAGKMVLELQPFAVQSLLAELENVLNCNVGNKALTVKRAVDPEIPQLMLGDLMRLRQVLTNLGANAVKFTEQGEVNLLASLISRNAQEARVRFAVQDTGIGIAPEKQTWVFDEFAQADAQTTRKFGGTGLGLSISKRLVELMGGFLCLESEPGIGSLFYFELTLPIAPVHGPDDYRTGIPKETIRPA